MKIAVVIARILLGLIFLVFGLNNFFQFIHAPMPPGDAGVMAGIMFKHGVGYLPRCALCDRRCAPAYWALRAGWTHDSGADPGEYPAVPSHVNAGHWAGAVCNGVGGIPDLGILASISRYLYREDGDGLVPLP